MISFECDYLQGAHPEILNKLIETNLEKETGYGFDKYSLSAKEKIRKAINCPDADIYFLTGGTQTNSVVISAMLSSYQGVIAADTGHIATHEAGAIEYTGHKVLTLPQHNGKISATELEKYLSDFFSDGNHEHAVFPGMVYISHPTEYGTLYSKSDLTEISEICKNFGIYLYMDGARLGYGIMSKDTDVTLEDISELCDAYYIGGTKVGALMGEAVVFPKNNAPKQFFTIVKQHGALLAKGRVAGIQFDTLFTNDLYFEISKNAIEKAERLKVILKNKGYKMFLETPTNQQFVIISDKDLEELNKKVGVSYWEKADETHSVVRFATSWATTDEDLDELEKIL